MPRRPTARRAGSNGSGKTGRRATNSADEVARHVRKLILDGELTPGQRLPQDDVATAVGVSRVPVREAIIALEREGWLRVERHRGAFVNQLDERAISDHYELYARYFGFAARRAIERMSDDDLQALDQAAAGLARVTSPAAVDKASRRYLSTLFDVAASNRLDVALRSMAEVVPGNFFAVVPGAIPVHARGIAALHEAIRNRDAAGAEAACLEMTRKQADRVASMVRARQTAHKAKRPR